MDRTLPHRLLGSEFIVSFVYSMLQRLYITDIQDPKLLECLLFLIQAMTLCKGDAPTETYRILSCVRSMDRQWAVLGFRFIECLARRDEGQQRAEQRGCLGVAVEGLGERRDLEGRNRLLSTSSQHRRSMNETCYVLCL